MKIVRWCEYEGLHKYWGTCFADTYTQLYVIKVGEHVVFARSGRHACLYFYYVTFQTTLRKTLAFPANVAHNCRKSSCLSRSKTIKINNWKWTTLTISSIVNTFICKPITISISVRMIKKKTIILCGVLIDFQKRITKLFSQHHFFTLLLLRTYFSV